MSAFGTWRTSASALHMSAFGPKRTFRETVVVAVFDLANGPKSDGNTIVQADVDGDTTADFSSDKVLLVSDFLL